jgi:GPH family glycoside/pentoside/hexuronide:cation symporter
MLSDSGKDKLSTRNLWGYGIGAIPAGLLAYVFSLKYVELFYDDLQLLPGLFIIGQIIYMTINALNDPLSGQLSDRTNREKWGSRRIIYIKYGAPIWALTFLLVWFPWSFDNQIMIFLHYVISICLFDTMLTLVVLVWMALLPEMTSDLDERNKGHFISLVFGAIFVVPFFLVLGDMEPTSQSFQILMIIIAVVSTLFLWLTAYLCEEKPEYLKDEALPLWKAAKETLKLKSFLIFVGFNFCGVFLSSIGLSYLFLWAFVLGDNSTILYFIIFILVGYGSNMLCMKLRPNWGMRKIILRFGLVKVVGSLLSFISLVLFQSSLIAIIGLIVATFFGGYGVFVVPIMYLSADEDEINQGIRREGMFLGMNALFTKPASSLGPIVATIILEIFLYVPGSETQSATTLIGIDILFLLIPAIVTAISLIFMYYYPLHGEKLIEMREKLEIIQIDKKQKSKS